MPRAISQYVVCGAHNHKPNDYVYIIGSEPQILFHANRRHATRYLFDTPLVMKTVYIDKYQKQAIQDFLNNPPAVIIVHTKGEQWLNMNNPGIYSDFIRNIINKNYEIVGAVVWEPGKAGYWQEPITNQSQINYCNLVLLKRK